MKRTLRTPKVTVLLPVYNGQNYLREAITSILGQTYTQFELLIINDASTDASEAVIRSFNDPRIRYIQNKKNIRLLATLNKGIELAQGEYVARMDQDDISLPQRLEKQVAFLQKNRRVAVAGGAAQLIDARGKKSQTIHPPTSPHAIKWSLYFSCPLAHPTVMMRRSVIQNLGAYTSPDIPNRTQQPSEDYDLWRRVSDHHDLANLTDTLVYLRKHDTNLTNLHHGEHLTDARIISRLAVETLIARPLDQAVIDTIWDARNKDERAIAKASNLIVKMHRIFCETYKPSSEDTRFIQVDTIKRLLRLAHASRNRSQRALIIRQAREINMSLAALLSPLVTLHTTLKNLTK